MLKPKYQLSGGPVFTFSCQWLILRPSAPVSYATAPGSFSPPMLRVRTSAS